MEEVSQSWIGLKLNRVLVTRWSVHARHNLDDEALGFLKSVKVTLAESPCSFVFYHFDIQRTGQISHADDLPFSGGESI